MEKIRFEGEAESVELYVLDSTRLAGKEYLLVSDVAEGDGDCFILEEIPAEEDGVNVYRSVEDEELLDYLAVIFGEQLDDVDIAY